jgi:hypothetical protein
MKNNMAPTQTETGVADEVLREVWRIKDELSASYIIEIYYVPNPFGPDKPTAALRRQQAPPPPIQVPFQPATQRPGP